MYMLILTSLADSSTIGIRILTVYIRAELSAIIKKKD